MKSESRVLRKTGGFFKIRIEVNRREYNVEVSNESLLEVLRNLG